MDSIEITGGCLCGQVKYRVAGELQHATMCHCGNCRKASGAQSLAWVTFNSDGFSWEEEPARYQSDTKAIWSFCSQCGTTLTYEHERRPDDIDITVGSLDDPEPFKPTRHYAEDEKLSWA
jgi:hypothetical protein